MAKMEGVVYFRTNDHEAIRRIREYFGMPQMMTVNGETKFSLDDDEKIEMLKKTEQIGFIWIRGKMDFNY